MINPKIVLSTFHMKFARPIPSYLDAHDKKGTTPNAYNMDAIDTFREPPKRIKYRPIASTTAVIVITPVAIYISFIILCVSSAFFLRDYETIKKNASSGIRTQGLLFTREMLYH